MVNYFSILDNLYLTTYNIVVTFLLLNIDLRNWRSFRPSFYILIVVVYSVSLLAMLFLGLKTYYLLFPLIVQIPLLLAFSMLSRQRGFKMIFVLLSSLIWCYPLLMLGNIGSSLFSGTPYVKLFLQIALTFPLILLIQKFLQPIYKFMIAHLHQNWGLFCAIPLSCHLAIYVGGQMSLRYSAALQAQTQIWRHALVLATFLMYLLIITNFKFIKDQIEQQMGAELIALKLDGARVYIDSLKQSQRQTAIHQHDLRHHLNLIYGYATDNNKEALLGYIDNLIQAVDTSSPNTFSKNTTVNLILTAFSTRAHNLSIQLIVEGGLPEELEIPEMDLCVLLSNALENAIKATANVTDRPRHVHVTLGYRHDQLFLKVKNPFEGNIHFDEQGKLPTSNEAMHGIGTQSIAYIVEKYGGHLQINTEDHIFTLTAIVGTGLAPTSPKK